MHDLIEGAKSAGMGQEVERVKEERGIGIGSEEAELG